MSGASAADPSAGGDAPLTRRLARDLPYYALAQICSTVLNVAAIAIFTRVLDREAYGSYVIVLAGVTVVTELGYGWLQQSALRYWHGGLSAGEAERTQFLTSLLSLLGISSLAAAVAWPILVPLLFPGVHWPVALAGLALLFGQAAVRMTQTRTRVSRELAAYFWYAVIPPLSGLAFGSLLVVWLDVGALGVVSALAAGYLLTAIIEMIRRFRAYVPRTFRHDGEHRRELVRFGLPIMIGALGGVALDLSDRFLLARYYGLGTAGVYVAAYGLAIKIDAVTMMVASAAFPLLVHDYESKARDRVGRDLARLVSAFTALYAPAVCGVALISVPLVSLVLGPDFGDAADYVVPLMPGVFMMGVDRYLSKAFQLAGNNRPRLYIILAAAIVNVGLNLALLPTYGPIVAAWTTSIGYVLMTVSGYLWSRLLFSYSLEWATLGKIACAVTLMCASVLFATRGIENPAVLLAARVGIGVATYALAALALDILGVRSRLLRRKA